MDTDLEQQELEQDIDLMPHHQEVNLLDSPHLKEDQVPSDLGGTEILGGLPESLHRVVQSHRESTPDDHTSSTQVEE